MTRLDTLDENRLVARIKALRAALDDLQTAQRIGSSSVRFASIYSGLTNDIVVNVTYGNTTIIEITYTPDTVTDAQTGYVWVNTFFPVVISGSGGYSAQRETLPAANGQQKFRYYIYGVAVGTNLNIGVHWVGIAFGTGTFTIAQV